MNWITSIIGIIGAMAMIKYREQMGDMIGEADWMQKIGGVYNLVIIVALFIFFFSVASLTGTTDIFLAPLRFLIPGAQEVPAV